MLKRLAKGTGIHCNAHSFRRGFCVHNVESGLSTRVVRALGGWQEIAMVERYSKSLAFGDALSIYPKVSPMALERGLSPRIQTVSFEISMKTPLW